MIAAIVLLSVVLAPRATPPTALAPLAPSDFVSGPIVNERGDFAVVEAAEPHHVRLNGNVVPESTDGGVHAHVALGRDALVYSCLRPNDDAAALVVVDLPSGRTSRVFSEGFVQRVVALGDGDFVVDVARQATQSRDVMRLVRAKGSLTPLAESPGFEFAIVRDGAVTVHAVSGETTSVALFRAVMLARLHSLRPPAASHNFGGRLSWAESYRLEGLVDLYRRTWLPALAGQIRLVAGNLLAARNARLVADAPHLPPLLWATKKYSIDRVTPLDLLVDDAMVAAALMAAVNAGVLEARQRALALAAAAQTFSYHEDAFDERTRYYHFPKGIRYHLDGLWAPHNMQSTMGLVAVRLWKATGQAVYRSRVEQLAARFRQEWERGADSRILWHYWPRPFYKGWTSAEQRSLNMPSRGASSDDLFEDVSHAGLSVRFLAAVREILPAGDLASEADLDGLRRTIAAAAGPAGAYSRFMSGNTSYQPASPRFLPTYGWADLREERLSRALAQGAADADVDSLSLFAAVAATAAGGGTVVLTRFRPQGGAPESITLDVQGMASFIGLTTRD